MKILKAVLKSAALFAACALAVGSLSSCNQDTSWTYRTSDGAYEVTSGMYIGLSINAYNEAMSQDGIDTSTSLYSQQIDSQDALDWVVNRTDTLAKKYLAVESKFDEYGLSFSEDEQSYIDSYIDYYWSYVSSSYEEQGCAETSYRKLLTNSFKESQLFFDIYGEDGERAVSVDDLRAIFDEQYAHVNVFQVDASDENGEALTGNELEIKQKEVDRILEDLENGTDFETVKAEYTATSNDEDTSSDAETSEEASEATSEESSEEVSEETSEAASEESSEEVSEETSETASEETSEESTEETSTEEEDSDTSFYITSDDTTYPEDVVTALFDAQAGEYGSYYDEDGTFYIWSRLENDDEGFESYRDTILQNEKWEEFTQYEQDWVNGMTFETNDASLKKHSPKHLE